MIDKSDLNKCATCNLNIEDVRRLAWGKTHYFDAQTTRFFGSHYSQIRQDGSEVRMVVSERVAWKGRRMYRVVSFDVVTGDVERLSTYDRTPKAAVKARALFDGVSMRCALDEMAKMRCV